MRAQISDRDYERISAYLDGQLSPGEKRKVEERLQTRPELQTVLEDLRQTRALLKLVPRKQAPRNFTLTPAMVGKTDLKRSGKGFPSLFPAFSFASALATIVLLVTVILELAPGTPLNKAATREAGESAMQPAVEMAAEPAPAAREEEQPLLEAPAVEDSSAPAPPMEALAQPAEPQAEKSIPGVAVNPAPVITWDNSPGMGGGGSEFGQITGQGSPAGEYAPAPKFGMGGGGSDQPYLDYSSPGGPFLLPLEAVESLPQSQPDATTEKRTTEETQVIQGPPTGPILGVAPSEQAGEIVTSSGWGLPLHDRQAELVAEFPAEKQRTILGLPVLRALQIMLLILAIITAAAAVFSRGRK